MIRGGRREAAHACDTRRSNSRRKSPRCLNRGPHTSNRRSQSQAAERWRVEPHPRRVRDASGEGRGGSGAAGGSGAIATHPGLPGGWRGLPRDSVRGIRKVRLTRRGWTLSSHSPRRGPRRGKPSVRGRDLRANRSLARGLREDLRRTFPNLRVERVVE